MKFPSHTRPTKPNLTDNSAHARIFPLLRTWKVGALVFVAALIAVGLLVNGSQESVVSAVGADVVSVSSGEWSDAGTWSTGNTPQPG